MIIKFKEVQRYYDHIIHSIMHHKVLSEIDIVDAGYYETDPGIGYMPGYIVKVLDWGNYQDEKPDNYHSDIKFYHPGIIFYNEEIGKYHLCFPDFHTVEIENTDSQTVLSKILKYYEAEPDKEKK